MSVKNLFETGKKTLKTAPLASFQNYLEDVESVSYIQRFIEDRKRVRSHTNFATASSFCVYGSLTEYYKAGINRIQDSYPYDGSLSEKLAWINESDGFDLHLFENEYPRTNGYIVLSDNRPGGNGWGTRISLSGAYGSPTTKEYISIKGGANVGNIYNTSSFRGSNLAINGPDGNTVEFWLKKGEYVNSKTPREVIFDSWATGTIPGDHTYGRMTIEIDSSDSDKSPFYITYQSGSKGYRNLNLGASDLYASVVDNKWHHYAFSMNNSSGSVETRFYVDGKLAQVVVSGSSVGHLNTPIIGSIGSLVAPKSKTSDQEPSYLTSPGLGFGKLSGSLDEFRFWKTRRNAKQIGRYWFTSIGAGSNTDTANSPLGVYYKFNEGITGRDRTDRVVLDYSGRITNGTWVGYAGVGRYNRSAMVEASASLTEFKDPIIYKFHPKVVDFTNSKQEEGYAYDLENSACLYHTMPAWIVDEDEEEGENLKKITQIVASYFDSLSLQIRDIANIKTKKYDDYKMKPHPFNNIKLKSLGLTTPELFMDANILNTYLNRDEKKEFGQKLSDVKNFIYNNIYNNLEKIYKSKGKESSFRNLFRCFGIDNELISINTYSDGGTYEVRDSYINTSVKTKYVNFNTEDHNDASVYQTLDGLPGDCRSQDARGYITGSTSMSSGFGFTSEVQAFFPRRYEIDHPFWYPTPLSASIMGCHSVRKKTGAAGATDSNTGGKFELDGTLLNWTSEADDKANFQLYAVKDLPNSRRAKLVLTCRNGLFDPVETEYIDNLYDSDRWNLAVKMGPKYESAGDVSGSTSTYYIELLAMKAVGEHIQEEYHISSSLASAAGTSFNESSKRYYLGTHRQDYRSSIIAATDIKLSNFRHWLIPLERDEIISHAYDPRSYGLKYPSMESFPLNSIGNTQVSKIDLLAINWDFANLTGSNSNGEMFVSDVSSGSLFMADTMGLVGEICRRIHPAKAINFSVETTASLDVLYDQSVRLQTFENVTSHDMINISTNDDLTFTRESRPKDHFYTFEKSMYRAITDEMLNFFAGVNDFNNLIGAPVEKYRQNYKGLEKLRQVFFERIQNSPDIERYTEYYKWVDTSLSIMIDQLIPASVASFTDIRNMIESHALERNKYQTKYPTIELKAPEPIGQIKGINEMLYDWEHGHAPVPSQEENNCLWWQDRAQRSTDLPTVDSTSADSEVLRRIKNTEVSGSSYVLRKLSRPYRFTIERQEELKGGDNSYVSKKKRFFEGVARPHHSTFIVITGSEVTSENCKDVLDPDAKVKLRAPADISHTNKDHDADMVVPFSLYSSSYDAPADYKAQVFSGFKKGVEITNLHSDVYGDDRENTIQSPFTRRYVGGGFHRNVDLNIATSSLENNNDLDNHLTRTEAFRLLAKGGKLYVLPGNARDITDGGIPIIEKHIVTSQIMREPLAKRPVNIRNIQTLTSSLVLGNFRNPYDVVQYTSENQRMDFLVENIIPLTSSQSDVIPYVQEFEKLKRPIHKNKFTARFAPVGGQETWGDALGGHSLDRETNQYSVYNTVNYRNLTVRGPQNYLDSLPQTASFDSVLCTSSNNLETNHKVNPNIRYRRKLTGSSMGSSAEFDTIMDNNFVSHPIPANDYQYSWITASLNDQTDKREISGYLNRFTNSNLGDATGSLRYEKTYEFISGNFGRFGRHLNVGTKKGQDYYNLNYANINVPGVNVRDDITVLSNLAESPHDNSLLSGSINYRQGPYGWPSWKQIRASETMMGRYLRRNSIFAPPVRSSRDVFIVIDESRFLKSSANLVRANSYNWPTYLGFDESSIVRANRLQSENNQGDPRSINSEHYRFKDPVVSSNSHPMTHIMSTKNSPMEYSPNNDRDSVLGGRRFINPIALEQTGEVRYKFYNTPAWHYSFTNLLSRYANPRLSSLMDITPSRGHVVELFASRELIDWDFTEGNLRYSHEIFPREKNAYLERTRGRTKFKTTGFWLQDRINRTANFHTNSQGQTIPKMSVWPLDAQDNYSTVSLKKTTDLLGDSGVGELFSQHSLFHNDLIHPSASALFTRPFPIQGTGSLKLQDIYEFTLSQTHSGKHQFDGDVECNASETLFVQDWFIVNTDSRSDQDGVTINDNFVPPGLENNAGHEFSDGAQTGASAGPRLYNQAGNVEILQFVGLSTAYASFTQPPAGSSASNYFRSIQTTASFTTPMVIDFHIKTGNSTTVGDSWGMHQATKPFYVQITGSSDPSIPSSKDTDGWKTVLKIPASEVSSYASTNNFKKHSIFIPDHHTGVKVRFVSELTGSTDYKNTDGQWGLKFLNIYEGKIKNMELGQSSVGTDYISYATVPDMTSSVRGVASRYSLRGVQLLPSNKDRFYYAPLNNATSRTDNIMLSPATSLSFVDSYKDERDRLFEAEQHPDANVYDTFYRQSGSKKHLVYSKNESLDHYLHGSQRWSVGDKNSPLGYGRNPFNYESYKDFAYQSRLIAKDFSVVPEFKISDHMEYYINEVGGVDPYFNCLENLLSVTGATAPNTSDQDNFYETYSHTDFMKAFGVVQEESLDRKGLRPDKLTLRCRAYKKFLPYKGFYPADRMTQLASIFSSSYSDKVSGGHWRNVLAPYYAPGIGFNTIKSGYAVDYPIIEPFEDRPYNKYGVIFMSASLKSGNPVGLSGRPEADKLSRNHIEIGDASLWAKNLTGSMASGDGKVAASFWIYFPTSCNPTEQYVYTSNTYSFSTLSQKGTILTFGNALDETLGAWKKGLTFAYTVGQSAPYSYPYSRVAKGPSFRLHAFGGDGKDFFHYKSQIASSHETDAHVTNNLDAMKQGWNHVYFEFNLASVSVSGFDWWLNGKHVGGSSSSNRATQVTASSGFNSSKILLNGHRNCMIGNHLGNVNRINDLVTADTVTTLYPNGSSMSNAAYPGSYQIGSMSDGLYFDSSSPEHIQHDLMKSADCIMSDMTIYNVSLGSDEIKKLSGFNKVPTLIQTDVTAQLPRLGDPGSLSGPVNPNLVLSSSKKDNMIAWYRMGNDTGFTSRTTHATNGLPVFNHAQDMFSGVVLNASSGTIESTDNTGIPVSMNMLSGTFYGFSDWSGSVARDLKFSPHYRQRWNGIADISNPAQYSYTYAYSRFNTSTAKDFHAWYHCGPDIFAVNTATELGVDKHLIDNDSALTSSATIITGSTMIPSFIVGSKHNFTDDSSIPRIGSASFGTQHFLGTSTDGLISKDEVYSHGWRMDGQGNTGIKKVHRVPFEAIIDPATHSPRTKDGGLDPVMELYEVEPHPSSSLLPHATRRMKRIKRSNNSNLVEYTKDFFRDVEESEDAGPFLNSEKYCWGTPKNSASLKAEFNLESAAEGGSLYVKAANNFYAEAMNFFLKEKRTTLLYTDPEPNFHPDHGKSYGMSIILNRGAYDSTDASEDNPMYSNPAAFGPPFDAGVYRSQVFDINNRFLPKFLDLKGYGFAPYTNPSYDGQASVNYLFTPQNDVVYDSIGKILEDTTAVYNRTVKASGSISRLASGPQKGAGTVSSYNKIYCMHLSESFNGMGFEGERALVQTYGVDGIPIKNRKIWTIQSKFECPTFNFNGSAPTKAKTDESVNHLPVVKGIWHQRSTPTKGRNGCPFMTIVGGYPKDLTPGSVNHENIGNLKDLIGMKFRDPELPNKKYIGEHNDLKEIREAVVAIPFRTKYKNYDLAASDVNITNEKQFFFLPEEEVYQAVRDLGHKEYKLKRAEDIERQRLAAAREKAFRDTFADNPDWLALMDNINNGNVIAHDQAIDAPPIKVTVRQSVLNMVSSMLRYNIPPQFNFLKYNNPEGKYIQPFAMYIFEFTHKLDTSMIWQNTTPDIGLDTFGNDRENRVITYKDISHNLFGVNDLLNPAADFTSQVRVEPNLDFRPGNALVRGGAAAAAAALAAEANRARPPIRATWSRGIDDEVRWMVFKVKQKAEANYFKKMRRDAIPEEAQSPESKISVENDIFEYGYNWPYDYFSLVELINLKTIVDFKEKSEIISPEEAAIIASREG